MYLFNLLETILMLTHVSNLKVGNCFALFPKVPWMFATIWLNAPTFSYFQQATSIHYSIFIKLNFLWICSWLLTWDRDEVFTLLFEILINWFSRLGSCSWLALHGLQRYFAKGHNEVYIIVYIYIMIMKLLYKKNVFKIKFQLCSLLFVGCWK